ncbi:MAG: hypothetical protein EOO07_04450 [Chitinophagaceae bacterium]|nr:MAG: hypothetical protein EOO07_04450 [Chitinophagaceae bacterium]
MKKLLVAAVCLLPLTTTAQSPFLLKGKVDNGNAKLKAIEDKDCSKKPITSADYDAVCSALISQEEASPEGKEKGLEYAYQEALWKMSCVQPGDSDDVIKKKIQAMWDKHKYQFNCGKYLSTVGSISIVKFAISAGKMSFWNDIERYKLDINFKDPNDNNKTVLDFILEQEKALRSRGTPDGISKANEYKTVFDYLRRKNAKLSIEL